MKQTLSIATAAIIFTFSQFAGAAQIDDARYNFETQTIELAVTYNGGCVPHDIELQIRNCTRANPMVCVAQVVDHTTGDTCRQVVQTNIVVPAFEALGKQALADVVIVGDNGSAVHMPLR